jgi:hypothetical protein
MGVGNYFFLKEESALLTLGGAHFEVVSQKIILKKYNDRYPKSPSPLRQI